MEDFILTDELQLKILQLWEEHKENPLGLKEFCQKIIPDCDSRDKRGIAIRKFLAEREIKLRPANIYKKKEELELREEQKQFVINNYSNDPQKVGMTCLEIAETIFNKKGLTNLHPEVQAVIKFVKTQDPKVLEKEDIVQESEYTPPKTIQQAAARVNKYILNAITKEDIEKNSRIQKNLTFLIRFCHLNRFISQVSSFDKEKDRKMFEGSYIRFVYDKSDLQEEDLELYINLCCDIVDYTHMRDELADLQRLFSDCADDTEGKRVSMSIVEAIKNLRKDIDDNNKRQKALIATLTSERNKRIDLRNKQDASLVQLIDFWKNYDNRQQIIALAEIRNKKIKEEIIRLETIDDLKLQLYGIDSSEII